MIQTSADSVHRTSRIIKNGLVDAKDPEVRTVLKDRQHIGTMADEKHCYIVIDKDRMDIISFLRKYQGIFCKSNFLNDIIKFVRNSLLLTKTIQEKNRCKIEEILDSFPKQRKSKIIKWIRIGFYYVIPEHYQYLVMFFWGWKTYEQMTQTDILHQAQRICSQDSGIYKIDVPREMIPATFVLYLAKKVGIPNSLCNKQLMRKGGFHHLDILLGALDCYYSLSIYIYIFLFFLLLFCVLISDFFEKL